MRTRPSRSCGKHPTRRRSFDIRLPDLDGFETYKRLREVQPKVPIILMTGFGWDPSHSIVKARQAGLQTVLYKPFRADRLMEAVEQALRTAPATGQAPAAASHDVHASRGAAHSDGHSPPTRNLPPGPPGEPRPIEASHHES